MASAEQLLNEAQYAFQSVSSGESPDNQRNASRARSLCNKIIRKFPTGTEAAEAHAILRRLGDEAYTSHLSIEHRHITPSEHHTSPTPKPQARPTHYDEAALFDWAGLLSVIFATSKTVLGVFVFFGVILFGIFGPFMLLPLIVFVLLTGPFRQLLKPRQRQQINAFITRANAYIDERRKSGTGLT